MGTGIVTGSSAFDFALYGKHKMESTGWKAQDGKHMAEWLFA
jgi:hypothetical protein